MEPPRKCSVQHRSAPSRTKCCYQREKVMGEAINGERPILGIDLGTTFSAIAKWEGRGARVYNLLKGSELPSVIYYDAKQPEKPFLVGHVAMTRGNADPENMVIGVKRK